LRLGFFAGGEPEKREEEAGGWGRVLKIFVLAMKERYEGILMRE
jgi:hypothetical protein